MSDLRAQLREVKDLVEELRRASPLNNASITSGPGLSVGTPEGIGVKPGGSISVESVKGVDVKPGGSIEAGDLKIGRTGGGGSLKVGATEATKDGVGSGGTKIGSNGKIGSSDGETKFEGGIATEDNVISKGYVDGRGGVYSPWGTGKSLVSDIASGIKATADGAANAAAVAHGRANDAYWLANGRATVSSVTAAKARADSAHTRIDGLPAAQGPTDTEWQQFLSQFYSLRTTFYQHTQHPPPTPGG